MGLEEFKTLLVLVVGIASIVLFVSYFLCDYDFEENENRYYYRKGYGIGYDKGGENMRIILQSHVFDQEMFANQARWERDYLRKEVERLQEELALYKKKVKKK